MALPQVAPTYQFLDGTFGDGTIFGQTSSSVIGFWGSVTNKRPANIAALVTTASTSTSSAFGWTTSTQAEAITTAVNAILVALIATGFIAAS